MDGPIDSIMDKNPKDAIMNTPLHWAARNGRLAVCQLIIDNVENKNPGNLHKKTPLHLAAMNGHVDVCKLIMNEIEDKNPPNEYGETPLHQGPVHLIRPPPKTPFKTHFKTPL